MVVVDHPSWAEVYQFFSVEIKKIARERRFFRIGNIVLSLAQFTTALYDEDSK